MRRLPHHDQEVRPRRHFDVAQANRALALVKRIVADVVRQYARLVDVQEMIETAQGRGETDRARQCHDELVEVAHSLQGYARELDDVGVELKDWSTGVVDFPCMIDGREAYLCWRPDEPGVEYWHELDEDTAGRHPIAELIPIH